MIVLYQLHYSNIHDGMEKIFDKYITRIVYLYLYIKSINYWWGSSYI